MRTFLRSLVAAGAVALTVVAAAEPARAQGRASRPTVAVLDLDYGTVQQWWSGNWDIGKGVADMIVDELVNDGSFRVIERKRLDAILAEQGVTVNPVYWSDRDDWTLSMIAAGLGFGFMPRNSVKHAGVVALPITEPEFWRDVNLVTVRGRRHSPAVGALVREAMQKRWFGELAVALPAAAE